MKLSVTFLALCLATLARADYTDPHWRAGRSSMVHLMDWTWPAIANECETFLAPNGYAGVQVSPANEHNVFDDGRSWMERYGPISYILTTRSGNEASFADMTRRCNAVGVRIYVDVVFNHMTGSAEIGSAGSRANLATRDYYAVPYTKEHFNPSCNIDNWSNPIQVRNCELLGLPDLNQGHEWVRTKIADFLNHLIDLGVAGFRVDAMKHMWPGDLEVIWGRLKNLNTNYGFAANSRPFVVGEVIGGADGSEGFFASDYFKLGTVTEFRFSQEISRAFGGNNQLKWLGSFGEGWGFFPSKYSLTFVDNHDNQRDGHVLTYKSRRAYEMATAFHMAWNYGIPRIMSSFFFENRDVGPPSDSNKNILAPTFDASGQCNNGWVCEHRWPRIAQMIGFRNAAYGTNVERRKKEYLKLDVLPFRAVPFYRVSRYFRNFAAPHKHRSFRRYYKVKRIKKLTQEPKKLLDDKVSQDEEMRIYLIKNSQEVDKWIEFIHHKEATSLAPREQREKAKLELIEKALHFNPDNGDLMNLYLRCIPNVHSSEKVGKLIEDLIAKDLYNIGYWKHLLNNQKTAMSCTAENALKLFEKSMKIMRKCNDSDPQMMMLFKSCCLFLRQSGLNEQFFAIIQLKMSLNINPLPELDRTFYTKEVQNPLLNEYEELVLKSDLPMNELWWRMETLRSICNFLPVRTASGGQMEDPQRYVFNEDVCNLVNPLKNNIAYKFDLFVVVLRLLKLPLPYRDIHNEIFAIDEAEMECGMEFLSVFLEKSFSTDVFNRIMFNVIKDLNISPNYLNINVEYEPYLDLMSKILVACCNAFNDRQNIIVLMVWLRLQRLMIVMDKLKLASEKKEMSSEDFVKYKKQLKSKVKNVLKTSKYQNDLNVFTEYALIEKALGDDKSCENILKMAMDNAAASQDSQSELDFYQIAMEFCEMKLVAGDKSACLDMLKKLAGDATSPIEFFTEKINQEAQDESTEIEDFFLPKSNKLNLIKSKVYFLFISRSKKSALEEILKHVHIAEAGSKLLEKLFELYVWIFHLKVEHEEAPLMKTYLDTVAKALKSFPRNLVILHAVAAHSTLRWFDIRKLLLKKPTTESIFYLMLASKYREETFNDEESVMVYKHRIYNTIDNLMSRNSAGISSILTWRLYLRTAFSFDFTKCKRILYQALDLHPMVRQLYLDGARYLPEEHSQLLDLIVEKGLRVHALAEELEILRTV